MSLLATLGAGATNFFGSSSGIGSLVSTGSNLLGNWLGYRATKKTNKTNLKINQMNNEFNERMMEKQMRYNSASEQVQRYKDAGLNPALMMQGQQAGQATAVSAASGAPMQAYKPDFSSIGTAIETGLQRYRENQMLDEQIKGVRIENQFKRQRILKELANLDEQRLSSEAKRRIDQITSQNLHNMQTEEYMLTKERRMDLRSQIEKRNKELLLLDKEIANFDDRWNQEKAESVSRVLLNGAMTGRSKQEMRTEVYNTIKAKYEAARQKLDNKTAARMADAIVEKAIQETLPVIGRYGSNYGDWTGKRKYGQYP